MNKELKLKMENLINEASNWKKINYVLESKSEGREKTLIEMLIMLHESLNIVAPSVIDIKYFYHDIKEINMGWGDPSITSDYCYTHWDLENKTVGIIGYNKGRDFGMLEEMKITDLFERLL